MENYDLIIGFHSVLAALENQDRVIKRLVCTDETREELKKKIKLDSFPVEIVAIHKLQEEAKQLYRELDLDYQRVPSGIFLVAESLERLSLTSMYNKLKSKDDYKILCLDQVSDVHNAAAILRTASFYGVDAVVVPDKKSFGLTPSFFRIASGAAEYVDLVSASKLTKVITKLKELNVICLGLSEHATTDYESVIEMAKNSSGLCVVLGKEDTGISHAVLRLIDHKVSLASMGDIKSLNVSIAAAVAMEKCFGK